MDDDGVMQDANSSIANLIGAFSHTARVVSDTIIDQWLNTSGRMSFRSLRALPVAVADVEANLEQLDEQIRFARGTNLTVPCANVGGKAIPVAIPEFSMDSHWNQKPSNELLRLYASHVASNENVISTDEETALKNVGDELSGFLGNRLAASHAQRSLGAIGMTSTLLQVVVSAHTAGARVSYSPSYFINYLYLGAPTTPVTGYLLPGRYVFMLTTLARKKMKDNGVFDVPPIFNVSLAV